MMILTINTGVVTIEEEMDSMKEEEVDLMQEEVEVEETSSKKKRNMIVKSNKVMSRTLQWNINKIMEGE
jgi:hypothetical protein